MRLHAYLAQALPPIENERLRLTQLPSIQKTDIEILADAKDLTEVAEVLETKKDGRASDVKKALEKWGTTEIVDAAFKGALLIEISSLNQTHDFSLYSHR